MRIIMALGIASAVCGLAALSPANATSAKFQTLYSFGGVPNDGAAPMASLIAVKGVLYGTTVAGGPQTDGTVYSIDPATGKEAIVSSLIEGAARAPVLSYKRSLYGTTTGVDTIFSVDLRTKHVTNLYNFPNGGDDQPAEPNGLTEFHGRFFGTTFEGGRLGCGDVFDFDPVGGVFAVLHKFACGVDGNYPEGQLVVHKSLLYGVTEMGGSGQSGTLFSVDPTSGAKKTLHSFDFASDGGSPTGVTFDNDIIFGSTWYGGVADHGTLFTFDPVTQLYTMLFAFPGGDGGCSPVGAPVVFKGKLYGVAFGCMKTHKYGVLYEVSLKTGEERVLHSFTNGTDGGSPNAGLLLYQGALYGTTMYGGAYGDGTVFRYTP